MNRWYTHENADNEFGFHPAGPVTGAVHDAVRQACRTLAHRLIELLPEGPLKTTAIRTHLLNVMWASNGAIATQHDPMWAAEMEKLLPIPPLMLQTPVMAMRPDELAEATHEASRRLVPEFGGSQALDEDWHDLPPVVAATMTAIMAAVLHVEEPAWVQDVRASVAEGKAALDRPTGSFAEGPLLGSVLEEKRAAVAAAVGQLSDTFLEPEDLAQQFHDTYERLAPSFGYQTREASAKPWVDVPDRNRALMTAVVSELLGVIQPGWVTRVQQDVEAKAAEVAAAEQGLLVEE